MHIILKLFLIYIFLLNFSLVKAETIKVGVLHSLSGTMAISETTLKDTILMLVEKQNKAGGILGKLEAMLWISFDCLYCWKGKATNCSKSWCSFRLLDFCFKEISTSCIWGVKWFTFLSGTIWRWGVI